MACVTQSHPFILRNSLIFILRYLMAQKSDEVRKLIMLFISFISLIGCGGRNQQVEKTSEWGDSIATINNTAYYWLQLADDSARISAVRDNMLVTECIVRGQVYGARQYDDGEIYILCGQNQISWFDVRHIPSEIDLMTEEEWDNYDPSQENADAIIHIGM